MQLPKRNKGSWRSWIRTKVLCSLEETNCPGGSFLQSTSDRSYLSKVMLIWGKQKEVNVFYTQGAGQVKVGCDFIPQEEKLFFLQSQMKVKSVEVRHVVWYYSRCPVRKKVWCSVLFGTKRKYGFYLFSPNLIFSWLFNGDKSDRSTKHWSFFGCCCIKSTLEVSNLALFELMVE